MDRPPSSTKVSQFPIPKRSIKPKKRGAELNKFLFIKKMDKVYFSIEIMQDILEELKPVGSATRSPSLKESVKVEDVPTKITPTQSPISQQI